MKQEQEKFSVKELVYVLPMLFLLFLSGVMAFPFIVFVLFVLPADTPPSAIYAGLGVLHGLAALFALVVLFKDKEPRNKPLWAATILMAPLMGPAAYLARKWMG